MTSGQQPSFGQRIYRALFKVFGPADVGPAGPPAATHPDDKTVPAGYHLETITDGGGNRRRIAVPNQADSNPPNEDQPNQDQPDSKPAAPKPPDLNHPDQHQPDPKQADAQ